MEPETNEQDESEEGADSYGRYLEEGGRLIELDYNAAKALSGGVSERSYVGDPTIEQIRGIAERSGITSSPEMIQAYKLLREKKGEDYPKDYVPTTNGTKRASDFDDKPLFAEMLLLVGRGSDYKTFVEKYPNSFEK